jgi:hypothetical protein
MAQVWLDTTEREDDTTTCGAERSPHMDGRCEENQMTDHESNLYDLYAGFAMMALLNKAPKSAKPDEIASVAHDHAEAMLKERTASRREAEGGIANILNKWGDKP